MPTVLQDIGKTLSVVAPTIAGLLGGPLASAGVTELENVLGVTPAAGATVEARAQALQGVVGGMTGDQIVAVRKANDALREKLMDAGVELAHTDQQDRSSARQMATTTKDSTPKVLTYLLMGACAVVAYVIISGDSPAIKDPSMAATVGTVVGYLFSELKAACTYWFGSSDSSAQKNDLIKQALESTPPGGDK